MSRLSLWSPVSTQNCLFSLDQWNNPNLSTTWQNILWARLGPMEMFIQSQSVVDINSVGISKFCFRWIHSYPPPQWTCHGWFLHFLSQFIVSTPWWQRADHASAYCWSLHWLGISLRVSQSASRLCLGPKLESGESSSDTTHHLPLSLSTVILQIFLLSWQNGAYGEEGGLCWRLPDDLMNVIEQRRTDKMITQPDNAGYWRVMQPWQDHNCVPQSQDGWTRAGALRLKRSCSAGIQTDSPSLSLLPQSTPNMGG